MEGAGSLRSLAATFVGLLTGSILLAAYAAVSALPHNPVDLPREAWVRAVRWFPQGWCFFTRDPREECLSTLIRDGAGRWHGGFHEPISSPENAFGLNRRARAQGLATAFLLAGIPERAWRPCVGKPLENAEALPVFKSVRHFATDGDLRGIVVFVKQPPIPWAWFAAGNHMSMPSRMLKLRIE